MFDFSDGDKSMESIFNIFLLVCIATAIVLELIKWWYSSQASGYLFTNTVSTFDPETYE